MFSSIALCLRWIHFCSKYLGHEYTNSLESFNCDQINNLDILTFFLNTYIFTALTWYYASMFFVYIDMHVASLICV